MPEVPKRELSRGELFNQRHANKLKRTNKFNHHQQRKAAKRKKQHIQNYYAERQYQAQLAEWLREFC